MKPRTLTLAMLMLALPTAGCTQERPKTVSVDTSCLAFKAISFAQLPAGVVDDVGNKADSDATVQEITVHNARFDALCGHP